MERRPVLGEIVVYQLMPDRQGRHQGAQVVISGDRPAAPGSRRSGVWSLFFSAFFFVVVMVAVFSGKVVPMVLAVYVLGSAVTFFIYAWDKSAAKNNGWRTPENTLHLLGLLGGWPGGLVAQRLLRHKSSKPRFLWFFWGTVVLNCCGLAWVVAGMPGPFMGGFAGVG
jgi:uncharacterized membrane protein YsdA (DUF1294 family)